MYFFWRIVWWFLDRDLTAWITAQLIRLLGKTNKKLGNYLLGKVKGLTKFPWKLRGWYNLHFSYFYRQVVRYLNPVEQTPKRQDIKRDLSQLRIGFVGPIGASHRFSKSLFEAFPKESSLFVVELQYDVKDLAWELEEIASGYVPFQYCSQEQYWQNIKETAHFINSNKIDLLLTLTYADAVYDLLNKIDTPVIFHISTSTEILHHEKVSLQLVGQETTDFYVRDEKVFSRLTRSFLNRQPAWIDRRFHDLRGFDFEDIVPISEREPVIMFHGPLYKMASPFYLDRVFNLLADDSDLNFIFAGGDDGDYLKQINLQAKKRNVLGQLQYLGSFTPPTTWNDGEDVLTAWRSLVERLKTAKLAPNPWPVGGGCTRFEAFAAGVPSIHMENSYSATYKTLDVPMLQVPKGLAKTAEEYEMLCRKVLYDSDFAESLMVEQLVVAKKSNDAARWWRQILEYYDAWVHKYA